MTAVATASCSCSCSCGRAAPHAHREPRSCRPRTAPAGAPPYRPLPLSAAPLTPRPPVWPGPHTHTRPLQVRGQLNEVKDIMVENIEKVLQRGEKIELLVDKTEALSQSAKRFQTQSKSLKNVM